MSETRYEAQWFDGSSGTPRPAEVWVDAAGLWVAPPGGSAVCWPHSELVLMRGDGAGEPVQLERRGERVEVVIVADRALLHALRAARPASQKLATAGSAGGVMRVLLVGTLALVLLAVLGYAVLLPWAADLAAERVPPEWEARYGEAVITDLAPQAQRSSDADTLAHVLRVRESLVGTPRTEPPIVLRSELPNAFAAPGGRVVVTTGLLRTLRSDDELAAVIAHELGHVSHRHVMRGMMRRMGLQVLLMVFASDPGAWSSGLRVAGGLDGLAYSRDLEREADDAAIATLRASGRPPLALAAALESLERAAPGAQGMPGFLSTHPATAERLERIRRQAR